MGSRTSYQTSQFSWIDLGTNDYQAAKEFYGGLFGWEFDDQEVGENEYYGIAHINGQHVAAIFRNPDLEKLNIPPHWTSYITVDEADLATEQCKQAGANVIHEPFDVFQAGRMAVFQDPTGAHFCIWQPKQSIGAHLVNEVHTWCWSELNTRDMDRAKAFYTQVFGWDFNHYQKIDYYGITNRGKFNAGAHDVTQKLPAEIPAHWMVYFRVANTASALGKIEDLGGRVMTGPFATPMGNIAVVADPQGAHFALTDLDQMDD